MAVLQRQQGLPLECPVKASHRRWLSQADSGLRALWRKPYQAAMRRFQQAVVSQFVKDLCGVASCCCVVLHHAYKEEHCWQHVLLLYALTLQATHVISRAWAFGWHLSLKACCNSF